MLTANQTARKTSTLRLVRKPQPGSAAPVRRSDPAKMKVAAAAMKPDTIAEAPIIGCTATGSDSHCAPAPPSAVATALGGAGAQWLSDPVAVQPMIGASAIVSGFMAAAATFIFAGSDRRTGAAEPGWGFLTNRNVLVFLAVWFAVNIAFGLLATPLGLTEGSIAWQAHIGGLAVGLALFPMLDPARSASTARGA